MLLITDKQVIMSLEGNYAKRKINFVLARNIIAQNDDHYIESTPEGLKRITEELGVFLETDNYNYYNLVSMPNHCNIAIQFAENEIYLIERS